MRRFLILGAIGVILVAHDAVASVCEPRSLTEAAASCRLLERETPEVYQTCIMVRLKWIRLDGTWNRVGMRETLLADPVNVNVAKLVVRDFLRCACRAKAVPYRNKATALVKCLVEKQTFLMMAMAYPCRDPTNLL